MIQLHRVLSFGLFIGASLALGAAEKPSVILARVKIHEQTSSATPKIASELPYLFTAQATRLPKDAFENIRLQLPNTGVFVGEPQRYGGAWEEIGIEASYGNLTAFNATFPKGTYYVRLNPVSGSATTLKLSVKNLDFPTVPKITNYADAQKLPAGSDFALKWNAFSSSSTKDRMILTVTSVNDDYDFVATPDPETPDALAASKRSYTIKAKTLPPGTDFVGQLIFVRADTRSETSKGYPYASGAASMTRFKIRTAGSKDTKAPTVSSSSPADGATKVSPKATLTITFKEPMRTRQGWSVSFMNLGGKQPGFEWTSPTKFTVKPPSGGWPKNTEIGIMLNPEGYTPWFQDLAGNPLAPKTFKFKTGS